MTIAPAPPRVVETVGTSSGSCSGGDLLSRLVSPCPRKPPIDRGLAGGLRAWLEDGIAAVGRTERSGPLVHPPGMASLPVVVRDGAPGRGAERARPGAFGVHELRACLTRVIFRLTIVQGPPRQPFEDALRALSVTEHGPDFLDALGGLRPREQAALRAFARARTSAIASQWRPVPAAWLPRTAERLRVPLGGGSVELSASADLVVDRPSDGTPYDGTPSVCLLRVLDERHGPSGAVRVVRARRALALIETLRGGAPPWRVATYDPRTRRLDDDEVSHDFLAAAVHDVLCAVGRP